MKIAIVKYNAGNIRSVVNSLRRLGVEPRVTDSAEELSCADKVIFPGVGEASSAMDYLRSKNLDSTIRSLRQPVIAICLGMQLLCRFSNERETPCLSVVPHTVSKFPPSGLKVPHMGWNNISSLRSELFANIDEGSRVYFVHSYFVDKTPESIAAATYGTEFSAAIRHNNFFGVQFHPEKSGTVGARILENFLAL